MDTNYYRKYEPLFNAWYIKEKIGEGSFGQVYEIERKEMGVTYRAAMKAITIPQSKSELKSSMAEGMSNEEVTAYYREIVQDIISEFILMTKLKGTSNVVNYEDHLLIEHEESIGWDILIRMELLTPLYDHMTENDMGRNDIIKMGIDLCKALELCQKYNIIHRDVKPENIFISNNGDYKLGDFGIARTVEKTSSGLSRKGTYSYMAPEVYRGDAYGATVDICSLGIVMYFLLNHKRLPFMPAYPAPITHSDKENAFIKRIRGTVLPPPANADGKLAEIVLKACSHEPKDRFSSATEMRLALENLLYRQSGEALSYAGSDAVSKETVDYAEMNNDTSATGEKTELLFENDPSSEESTELLEKIVSDPEKTESGWGTVTYSGSQPAKNVRALQGQKKKTGVIAGAVAGIIVLAAILIFALTSKEVEDITGIEVENTLYVGESISPEYGIVPEKLADEKISFAAGNDRIISVDENGVITGIKAGSTTLTMTVKNYEESVAVIVSSKVTGISNVEKQIRIEEGYSKQLNPVLHPKKFADERVTYKIKNKKIASIDSKGKLKALKPGKTTLTIKAGGYSKTVKIIVTKYVKPTPEPVYQAPQYTPTPAPTQAPTQSQPANDGDGYWE